jgi:hypothetical protein
VTNEFHFDKLVDGVWHIFDGGVTPPEFNEEYPSLCGELSTANSETKCMGSAHCAECLIEAGVPKTDHRWQGLGVSVNANGLGAVLARQLEDEGIVVHRRSPRRIAPRREVQRPSGIWVVEDSER